MVTRPYRNGKGARKTQSQRKATHKSKYGTSKLPKRKYKNRK